METEAAEALVHFVELAGPGAPAELARAAARARAAGADVELLAAVDQAELWVLLVRGASPTVPPGARHWRFRAEVP